MSADLVQQLLQARAQRCPTAAPAALDIATARTLQQCHTSEMLSRFGGEVIGLKLGGTNQQAMEQLGMHSPFTGPIFSSFTQTSPARLPRSDFLACIVEAEIGVCFRMDFGGDGSYPDRDALIDAIDSVFPAIEVADSRYADWAQAPLGAIVADIGYAGAWVRGAPCVHWRELDLRDLPVRLVADGAQVRSGNGNAVLGDPLHALSLVIADLGRIGRKLHAGDLVSTGTCTAPLVLSGPAALEADFGPLGRVHLALT